MYYLPLKCGTIFLALITVNSSPLEPSILEESNTYKQGLEEVKIKLNISNYVFARKITDF